MARGGRTSIKGFKKSPSLKIRVAVSNQDKHDIIRHIADHGVASAVDTYFPSLNRDKRKQKKRQLLRWVPQKAAIAKRVGEGDGALCKSRSKGTGCVLPSQAEEQLVFWVRDLRKGGIPASHLMLQLKARDVATELCLDEGLFAASRSWRKRFLDVNQLSLRRRTRHEQVTPDDARVVAEQFCKKVQASIIEHNITEIYNADQTATYYEHLPTHTIDTKGTRTVWVRSCGKDKSRMAVMLLAASSGNKHAPFVVFKQPPSRFPATEAFNHREQHGFGRTLWRSVKPMQETSEMEIYCNAKGWWNLKLSLQWLEYHFAYRDSIDDEVLLIWDEFSGHWTEEVREYAASINVLLVCVPGGYTSVCQPADIAWMRPFKLRLREQWIKDMQEQFRDHREGESHETDVTAFSPTAPSRAKLIKWLDASWSSLPKAAIVGGLSRIGIPSDQREAPEKESRYEDDLQNVLHLLAKSGAAIDVGNEAEEESEH